MNVMLLAPHQDDEILSAYLYLSQLKAQDHHVSVVFATNGDYHGKYVAQCRYKESMDALQTCGIFEKDIYYMGYADTGMQLYHSFLFQLYHNEAEKSQSSPCSKFTYHPINGETVHRMFYKEEAVYSRNNFVIDLKRIILYLNPDILIMPSTYDTHGDHLALALFTKDVLRGFPSIICYTYLIHGGNDNIWPPRGKNSWLKPESVPIKDWNNRFIIWGSPQDILLKRSAILKFKSQLKDDADGFLMSFSKENEFFFRTILP